MCKSKKLGGLAVRGLRLIKLAFLGKWRCQFISDESSLYCEIIYVIYEVLPSQEGVLVLLYRLLRDEKELILFDQKLRTHHIDLWMA